DDGGVVPSVRDQPQDGLCGARAVAVGRSRGAGGTQPRPAPLSACARRGPAGGGSGGAAAAPDLGSEEGEGVAGTAAARDAVAGRVLDRGALRARGADGAAPAATARTAAHGAVRGLYRAPRRVEHGFQGLVPDGRRAALRPADGAGPGEPLSRSRGGGRAHGRGPRVAGAGGGVSRARAAAGDPLRQRRAVRIDGRGRAIGAVGAADQGGGGAGADRSCAPAAERPARAAAPDAEGRYSGPAGGNAAPPGRALPALRQGLQRGAATRGAGARYTVIGLLRLAAGVERPAGLAGVRRGDGGAACAP